ncbi:MAG TPA: C39 family peptidase, partial [Ktedonobacteraceae bacterium]
QSGLADGALQQLANGLGFNPSQHLASFDINTALPPLPFSATANVVRVDSAARNQYYTDYQWQVWSYSSCSGISMEMVVNAYGHNYIASDFLQKEADLGVWNVYQGLTGGEPAIAQTAAYFGFKALPNPPRTLQALIYTVNKGYPVIVGNPGHIMVVRGGDDNYIYVADSSPANRTAMTHAQFLDWWDGFSVVLVPR